MAIINYQPLTYQNGNYDYPQWAHLIGWTVTLVTLLCIPAFAIFNISRAQGTTLIEVN